MDHPGQEQQERRRNSGPLHRFQLTEQPRSGRQGPCKEIPIPTSVLLRTAGLLILSNLFMTYAWYGHLRSLSSRPWYIAALVSWGIAFFEYMLQVPANRIGYTALSLGQLKILQEVITLAVFVPFALFVMRQPLKLDFLWAALCMCGAVYFMFRSTA